MNIGLTYDLRLDYLAAGYGEEETAEFDRPDTIDSIEGALQKLGHRTERIGNIHALTAALVEGRRWDLVFNIAEGLHGIAREAQVPALLDAYEVPYTFSDPLVLALTLHKGMTKRMLRDLGVPTTDFVQVDRIEDVGAVKFPFPVFAKPIAEGTAKGIDGSSMLASRAALEDRCRRLLVEFRQPVLVEPYLPGRELTVGIVGTGDDARSIGVLEVHLLSGAEPHSYTYVNKERCEELCKYVLVKDALARQAEEISLAAWRGLNCRDAGRVDLRADADGRLMVMELNPLSGLHPEHSDLPILATQAGIPYLELMRRLMDSAAKRVDRNHKPRPIVGRSVAVGTA